jgi:hypothetical protein
MASVYRQDTGELLGYLMEPEDPFPGGITYWPFKAWVHSDRKLRSEPEPGTDETTPAVTVDIPVRNNDSADLHLMVPPDLVDFIVTHEAFRREKRR